MLKTTPISFLLSLVLVTSNAFASDPAAAPLSPEKPAPADELVSASAAADKKDDLADSVAAISLAKAATPAADDKDKEGVKGEDKKQPTDKEDADKDKEDDEDEDEEYEEGLTLGS